MSTTFCGSCGTGLDAGTKFCHSCGHATPAGPPAPVPHGAVGTVGSAGAVGSVGAVGVVGSVGVLGTPADPVAVPTSGSGAPRARRAAGAAPETAPPLAGWGQRVVAALVDTLVTLVLASAGLLLGFRGSGLLVSVAGALIATVALLVLATAGSSFGKALLGLRVVRADTGTAPGALGIGRLLLRQLLLGVTLGIAGFSPLWDEQRRGWWDRACTTLVVRRTGSSGPATSAPPTTVIDPAPQGRPQRDPADMLGLPDWARASRSAPAAEPSTPVQRPVTSWDDRPAAPAPDVPRPAPERPGLQPVGGLFDSLADEARPAAPPLRPVPVGGDQLITRAPSASSAPAASPVSAPERTTLRPLTPQATSAAVRVEFDDGQAVPLTENLLVGRDPEPRPTDGYVRLHAVPDETRSISKTHLLLEVRDGQVFVTDRKSTNGVAVVTRATPVLCVPGEPTHVPVGSTVRFGDRELQILSGTSGGS